MSQLKLMRKLQVCLNCLNSPLSVLFAVNKKATVHDEYDETCHHTITSRFDGDESEKERPRKDTKKQDRNKKVRSNHSDGS